MARLPPVAGVGLGETGHPDRAVTPDKTADSRNGSGIAGRTLHWLFVNRRTDRITVAQWPNIPLLLFIILSIALRFIHFRGDTETVLRALAVAALVVWAGDEVVRGVNPFRRILGIIVLLATIANLVFR
jgi:hypothetical protein